MANLPEPRGPVSEELLAALRGHICELRPPSEPLDEEDLQLALYTCYELQYRGFDDVDERWESDPSLVAFRTVLEEHFEFALEDAVGPIGEAPAPEQMDVALRAIRVAG